MGNQVIFADHNPERGENIKLTSGRIVKILEYFAIRSMNETHLINGKWLQVYIVRTGGEGVIRILPSPRGANPWKQLKSTTCGEPVTKEECCE